MSLSSSRRRRRRCRSYRSRRLVFLLSLLLSLLFSWLLLGFNRCCACFRAAYFVSVFSFWVCVCAGAAGQCLGVQRPTSVSQPFSPPLGSCSARAQIPTAASLRSRFAGAILRCTGRKRKQTTQTERTQTEILQQREKTCWPADTAVSRWAVDGCIRRLEKTQQMNKQITKQSPSADFGHTTQDVSSFKGHALCSQNLRIYRGFGHVPTLP